MASSLACLSSRESDWDEKTRVSLDGETRGRGTSRLLFEEGTILKDGHLFLDVLLDGMDEGFDVRGGDVVGVLGQGVDVDLDTHGKVGAALVVGAKGLDAQPAVDRPVAVKDLLGKGLNVEFKEAVAKVIAREQCLLHPLVGGGTDVGKHLREDADAGGRGAVMLAEDVVDLHGHGKEGGIGIGDAKGLEALLRPAGFNHFPGKHAELELRGGDFEDHAAVGGAEDSLGLVLGGILGDVLRDAGLAVELGKTPGELLGELLEIGNIELAKEEPEENLRDLEF